VIVPALTFIAHPNSVRYNNLDVVFADVGEDWTMNLDGMDYEGRTLLFPAALMGRTVNHASMNGCPVIEDACEAFGTKGPDGRMAGRGGEMGTYSFFPSHTISTGEGGAIVTDSQDAALMCRILRSHGAVSGSAEKKFEFDYLGFNARMSTMQAVLGIAVMGHIHEYISEKRAIFKLMQERLGGFSEKAGEEVVPHAYPIAFRSEEARDYGMKVILEAGIECRKFFSCIPKDEPPYRQPGEFPMAEKIAHTHLYLPCNQNMSPEDVFYMENVLSEIQGIL
jgi:perosamine synthetase